MKADDALHERYFGQRHVTIIEPRGGSLRDMVEVWAFRELLWTFVLRDIKVRYKQAALGIAWALIKPALTLIIMSVFFGFVVRVPSDGYPYPLFVCAAMIPWQFFSQALSGAAGSMVGASSMVGKIYFPRLIVPISTVLALLMDFCLSIGILLALFIYYQFPLSWNLLAFPLLTMLTVLVAIGVGTTLAALTVTYRDFKQVAPVLVQVWMYSSPIIYPSSLVPEQWRTLYFLNPMAGLIEGYRSCLLGREFDWPALGFSAASAMVLALLGVNYFVRVQRRFADVI